MVERLIKKAAQSHCRHGVSAVALDKRGKVLGYSVNKPRFYRKGGGYHAEMLLMARYRSHIKTIIICRVGSGGDLLPIRACDSCTAKADQLGISIRSIS